MRVLPALIIIAAATHAGAACLIRGTVVDGPTQQPLPRTRVFAKPNGDASKVAILRVADAQGGFCFERLDRGGYQVVADRPGYVPALYGAKPGGDEGLVLQVDGQTELPPMTLRMTQAASLYGMVVDATGQVVEGAHVELSRKMWDRRWTTENVASADTDERGAYRFGQLAPGTYFVSADPGGPPAELTLDERGQPVRIADAKTFWPSSLVFSRATPITINPGQQLPNIVLQIMRSPLRNVTGKLGASVPVMAGSRIMVRFSPEGDAGNGPVAVQVDPSGAFSVHGLMALKYTVRVENLSPVVQAQVDLTATDVAGLVLEAPQGFPLKITSQITGHAPPAQLELRPFDRPDSLRARRGSDGVYLFSFVPAGTYQVETEDDSLFVKNLRVDGQARPDAMLEVRQPPPGAIEAVVSANVGRIQGRLNLPEGATLSRAASLVWMDEGRSRTEVSGSNVPIDHTGKFKVDSLPPGKYRVFAIEGYEEGPWGSLELAAVLRDKSVAFELREGESKELAPPLISADEFFAALRKVGM